MHSQLPSTQPEKSTSSRLYNVPQSIATLSVWLREAAASRLLVYTAFSVLYLVPTIWLCRFKLIWEDEFLTYYLARTPDWHSLLQAMLTGADQTPPPVFYLTHWLLHIFGNSHLVLRLPALVGFWLLCICAYEIVRSLVNPSWAIVAMLFPLTTDLYRYASQARGYGLVMGFTALAVLCWLNVTENRHRKVFLPLLALSLTAAVSSHYYAVLIAFSLGIGELVRSRTMRRLDPGVWIALAFTVLPILVFLPILHNASKYSATFWGTPVWSDALLFYPSELGLGIYVAAGLLAVALTFGFSLSGSSAVENKWVQQTCSLKRWQATALCLVAAIPILAMILAKFVTHAFTNRYAISAAVGITVLSVFLVSRLAPRHLAALSAALIYLFFFLGQFRQLRSSSISDRRDYVREEAVLSQTGTEQIAVDDWALVLRLSLYAPRDLASRINYIADPANSDKFIGEDTADLDAIALRPWLPVQTVSTQSFLQSNARFLAYNISNRWDWLIHVLPDWGEATLISSPPSGETLFSMDRRRIPPEAASAQEPRITEATSLFSRMPRTGPSLCVLWMGTKECP